MDAWSQFCFSWGSIRYRFCRNLCQLQPLPVSFSCVFIMQLFFLLIMSYMQQELCYVCTFFRRNQELIKELSTPAPNSKELYFPTKYSQSFFVQYKANFWKQNLSYWRHSQYNGVRFLMTLVIGLSFGLIFWQQAKKT